MIGSLTSWRRLYCVLRGGKLFCYYSPEEIEAKLEPALTVSINKVKMILCGAFFLFVCLCFFIIIILEEVVSCLRHTPKVILALSCWYAENFIGRMSMGYASVKFAVAEVFLQGH